MDIASLLGAFMGGGQEPATQYRQPGNETERRVQQHAGRQSFEKGAIQGSMGDPQWLQLLKAGANPDFVNQLLRNKQNGMRGQSAYGAFHKDSGHSGMQQERQARPSVRSTSGRPSSFGMPAKPVAGPQTQAQKDLEAWYERRRQKEQMDMEMAQRARWLNAMGGLGGLGGPVSEREVTGQMYNNAGQHKVMPIVTTRSRDITPQEKIEYINSLFGSR